MKRTGSKTRLDRAPRVSNPQESLDAVVDRLVAQVRSMTPRQKRQSLINAGIFTPDGQLTEPYRESGIEKS